MNLMKISFYTKSSFFCHFVNVRIANTPNLVSAKDETPKVGIHLGKTVEVKPARNQETLW